MKGWDWRGLYLGARRCGLSAETFWGLTVRELFREWVIEKARLERQHDRDVTQAWHAVRIWVETQNKKRMPPLAKQWIGSKAATNKPPSLAKQLAVLEVLSAQFGIPLRKSTRRKSR